jgi:hypothetical protein
MVNDAGSLALKVDHRVIELTVGSFPKVSEVIVVDVVLEVLKLAHLFLNTCGH